MAKNQIVNAETSNEDMYVSLENDGISKYSEAISKVDSVTHTNDVAVGSHYYDFSDLLPGISSRPGLTRDDYSRFRPNEAIPQSRKRVIELINDTYMKVGLIRNVIDLMGDFACQGISIVHRDKRKEKFYKSWFEQVNGKERSERFLNNLYRVGTVVIRRMTAKLPVKKENELYNSQAIVDKIIVPESFDKREIPWQYTFINPLDIDVLGGPLASFVGKPVYILKSPPHLLQAIKQAKSTDKNRQYFDTLLKEIPRDIIESLEQNKQVVLEPDKTLVFCYKKDDWQILGNPMLEAILSDIIVLNKLKLADIAALDGAISKIRIFKLGSLEYKIAPTSAGASKLQSILEANVGVGSMDLIWGPDIELIETNTDVHQFLGQEKYLPTLKHIYDGLGIPPTLTSTFGSQGTTNNAMSLKTLTQRLQYGRDILNGFWNNELKIIQKALGHRFPATVEYDSLNLTDEDAQKRLLIQMADRNLISEELLQRKFGHNPELEKVRMRREKRERKSGIMIPKAGPFHDPEFDKTLSKIALQTGIVSPSEVGLELQEKKKGEKNALQFKNQAKPPGTNPFPTKKPSSTPRGRPNGAKDKQKRKPKIFRPVTKASIELWANEAQDAIAKKVTPILLAHYGKKNMRMLTTEEAETVERVKFDILWNTRAMSEITDEGIYASINNEVSPSKVYERYKSLCSQVSFELKRSLTLDEQRRIQTFIYINNIENNYDETNNYL